MAYEPCTDIASVLVSAGIGTFAGTSSSTFGIYVAQEPELPNNVVTVYLSGGFSPDPKWLLDRPTVQVRVRADGYLTGFNKSYDIKNVLLGKTPTTINGTYYASFIMISDITYITRDPNNRFIFSTNWQLVTQPSPGTTNRSSL